MSVLMVQANQCDLCGHIWLGEEPKRCASCKSSRWNGSAKPGTKPAKPKAAREPKPSLEAPGVAILDVVASVEPKRGKTPKPISSPETSSGPVKAPRRDVGHGTICMCRECESKRR